MRKIITMGEPMALFVAEELGVLTKVKRFSRFVSGAEVNFAIGMTRLGHSVTYVTQLGDDPFGKGIQQFFAENGIDASHVLYDKEHATGMQWKEKVSAGDPAVFNLRRNSAAANMTTDNLAGIRLEEYAHLHLTGIPPALSDGCREMIYAVIAKAKEKGIPVSFDPNLRPGLWADKQEMVRVINELACQADIVFPGISEGRQLTGFSTPEEIAAFYQQAGVKTVVVKLGEQGAYAGVNGEGFYIPGVAVPKVVDTVGAGDGFAVGVISALLEEVSLAAAVQRGAAIGALAVMSPGDNDGLPTRAQLAAFMARHGAQGKNDGKEAAV